MPINKPSRRLFSRSLSNTTLLTALASLSLWIAIPSSSLALVPPSEGPNPTPAAPPAPTPAPAVPPASAPPPAPAPEAAPPPAPAAAFPPAPPPAPAPDVAPAAAPAPEPAPIASPAVNSIATPQITGAPGKGLSIKVSEAFSLNIRSRFQIRYQLDIPPENDAGERDELQTMNIGTARLWLSGNVFRRELTYMLQLALAGRDYRDGAISPIFDAYLDWKAHRDFNLRAGQFFVPFDRLRTVREFALQMADRPVPIGELTLDRDVGIALYSDKFLGSPFAWRLGAFGGGGTNLSAGKQPGFLFMARVEARPLGPIDDDSEGDLERREKPGLAIGAGVARNGNTNRQRSTTGATFVGGTTDYLHLAADLVFKWRGFAGQLEYLWKDAENDQIVSLDAAGEAVTEWTRSGRGWVAQASYTFDPPFEIVGRLSKLSASDGTDPRLVDSDEYGVGANYYFNGHQFKLQADWIAKVPTEQAFSDAAHVVHLQLDATF